MKRKKRSASEFARIYGSRERVEWVKTLPCAVASCGLSCGPCDGEIHNAHTVSGGKGRKADAATVAPLCAKHHAAFDQYKPPFDTRESRAVIIGAAAGYDLAFSTRTE